MHSKRSLEGYYLRDESACLGGKREEFATLTCCHCHRVWRLNPLRTRERNHCRKCDKYVCDSPACNLECNGSLNKVLDTLQEQAFQAQKKGGLIGF